VSEGHIGDDGKDVAKKGVQAELRQTCNDSDCKDLGFVPLFTCSSVYLVGDHLLWKPVN
jgi:hypothetical protein